MLVNADFSRRAILTPDAYRWMPSPQTGVERIMLDRIGGEVARATSIVRYAPQSSFPLHQHPGGEEILVLSGTFSDETRAYPAGWYLRNPPGSTHRPCSTEGATIFVKLWQMQNTERTAVRVDTRDTANWAQDGDQLVCKLFTDAFESVCLQQLKPGQPVMVDAALPAELLVLDGAIEETHQAYVSGSWLRFPAHQHLKLHAGTHGATIYMKTSRAQGVMP